MDEILKLSKFALELKQTTKGVWYAGSFKINAESLQELDALVSQGTATVQRRLLGLNAPEQEKMFKQESKQEQQPLPPFSPEEEKLFQNLKELRLVLAKQEGVPPYVVFHDATLRRIVKERPATKEAMLAVIGEKKLAKYGELLAELLERHGVKVAASQELEHGDATYIGTIRQHTEIKEGTVKPIYTK